MFRLGYNTNGLAHHRPLDALELLADLGYEAVALTPDVGALDLYDLDPRVVSDLRSKAEDLGLDLALETGARFLLDPRRKHWPTLLEDDALARERRLDFLRRTVALGTPTGRGPGLDLVGRGTHRGHGRAGARGPAAVFAAGTLLGASVCRPLGSCSSGGPSAAGVQIAFEPEPGMFIERPSGYGELVERLGACRAGPRPDARRRPPDRYGRLAGGRPGPALGTHGSCTCTWTTLGVGCTST